MFGLKAKECKKRKLEPACGVPAEAVGPPPWMKDEQQTHMKDALVNALLNHAAKDDEVKTEEKSEAMAAGSTDDTTGRTHGPFAGWSRFRDQRVTWQTIDLCVLFVFLNMFD